jgi:hypothetical protein
VVGQSEKNYAFLVLEERNVIPVVFEKEDGGGVEA